MAAGPRADANALMHPPLDRFPTNQAIVIAIAKSETAAFAADACTLSLCERLLKMAASFANIVLSAKGGPLLR